MHEIAVFHEQMDKALELILCRNWFQLKQIKIEFQPSSAWYEHAQIFMQKLLETKRDQCDEFVREMNNQKGKTVYVAGHDKYWCCGFYERIAKVTDPAKYPGRNVLGEMLYSMINT